MRSRAIFADTSAFLAILNAGDPKHKAATDTWDCLVDQDEHVITSSYTLIETITLLHSRQGTAVVEQFLSDIMSLVEIVWADVPMHMAAVTAMLAHPGKSGPSLVDCMSFEVIRRRRIEDAFAYDPHFAGRGFNVIG
jgi:predicted nucleic acid-binding protein